MEKKTNKITCTIILDDQELWVSGDNMNEIVDKIIEWQDWDNNKDFLPKKVVKNWYYYKTTTYGK